MFQNAWKASDNLASFKNALEDNGYFLAQGDRRGFVAHDIHGEVFSVSRWAGLKTKELSAKLGKPDALPTVEQSKADTAKRLTTKLRAHLQNDKKDKQQELEPLLKEAASLKAKHRTERSKLEKALLERERREVKDRASRFRRGLGAVLNFLTGKTSEQHRTNEREAYAGFLRDRGQREGIFFAQNKDRQALQSRIDAMRAGHRQARMMLARQIIEVLRPTNRKSASRERERGVILQRERMRGPSP